MSSSQSQQSSSEERPTQSGFLGWPSSCARDNVPSCDNRPLDIQSFTSRSQSKVNESILKEIKEWFELSEKDGHISHSHNLFDFERLEESETLFPKHIANLTPKDVAIQLLASCSTEFEYHLRSTTLPTALYLSKARSNMISSLKMHSYYRLSPASGYHPRDPSPAPAWPGLTTGPSPEEKLAEQVSRRRKLEMLQTSPDSVESMHKFSDWSHIGLAEDMYQPQGTSDQVVPDSLATPMLSSPAVQDEEAEEAGDELEENDLVVKHFGSRLKRSRSFWFGHLRPARFYGTDESDDQPVRKSLPERRSAADLKRRRLNNIPSSTPNTYIGKLSNIRGRRVARWDFNAVIGSEPHPLFIQPVRDYKLRRSKSKPEGRMRGAARMTFMPPASAPDTKGTNRSSMSSPSLASSTPGMLSAISSNSRLRPAPLENARRVPTVTPVSWTPPNDPSDLTTPMEYFSERESISGGTPPESPSELITALEYLSVSRQDSEGEMAPNSSNKDEGWRRSSTT
jgi:hypothetical protein